MIFMPALNLLVYNVLVGYISMEINRIINGKFFVRTIS